MKVHKRKFQKFDMSEWYMGEDIESASSFPAADFKDNVTKLAESFAEGLEGKFQNAVRDGVSMAMSFIASDKYYCGFHFSERKNDNNPDGVPSIAFYFGEDYQEVEPLSDFFESCSNANLNTLIECIEKEKEKRVEEGNDKLA